MNESRNYHIYWFRSRTKVEIIIFMSFVWVRKSKLLYLLVSFVNESRNYYIYWFRSGTKGVIIIFMSFVRERKSKLSYLLISFGYKRRNYSINWFCTGKKVFFKNSRQFVPVQKMFLFKLGRWRIENK